MFKTIFTTIFSNDFKELNQLIKIFNSCVRFSYCRFKKDKENLNEVRRLCKIKFPSLNCRMLYDAVLQGQSYFTRFKEQKVVFGGKKNFKELKNKNITKEEWSNLRDQQIYFRGENAKNGNLNARIILQENNKPQLRINFGIRNYKFYDLFIPFKFKKELKNLLQSGIAYNIRINRKDLNSFKVNVDYRIEEKEKIINLKNNGCLGVDINPDRIAFSNISKDGNLIKTESFIENKLKFAKTTKRNYQISLIVKELIKKAKELKKGIVFEDLDFKDKENKGKRFNRMSSNFIWKKFSEKLERKCLIEGIEFKKVNPAFTSIIGKFKYP